MDVMKLLEYLEDIIETSSKVPMTGKIMVDKKEVSEVLNKIINLLPEEFKKAQWIVEEKKRIINNAVKQSELLKKENLSLLKKQVENHDITSEAKNRADEIVMSAQKDAKLIRCGAREYAEEILSKVEAQIKEESQEMVAALQKQMEDFLSSMGAEISSTTDIVEDNIEELRSMNKE